MRGSSAPQVHDEINILRAKTVLATLCAPGEQTVVGKATLRTMLRKLALSDQMAAQLIMDVFTNTKTNQLSTKEVTARPLPCQRDDQTPTNPTLDIISLGRVQPSVLVQDQPAGDDEHRLPDRRGRRERQPGQGVPRLTAATPMDNPYCSCKLTRVNAAKADFSTWVAAVRRVMAHSCNLYGESLLQL